MMRVIARRVPINQRIMSKRVHRDPIFAPAASKISMRQDELRGIVIIAEVARKRCPAHSNFDVFSDLQV